jgi:nucleotide-binding universal stress UspA family protein
VFKTILVPLDGTYLADRAVSYAVKLAKAGAAEVVLYHWAPPPSIENHPADERAASLQVEARAAEARDSGVHVETIIDRTAHDDASTAVIDGACARQADLIVMGSHGRSGLQDAVFGSGAERVARSAAASVLVIPADYDRPWAWDPEVRILIALDGSAESEMGLVPAKALADELNAPLLLVRVVEAADQPGALEDAQNYLEVIRDRLQEAGLRVEVRVSGGRPPAAIVAAATDWSADLIVLATHARDGLARLLTRSVAADTVRASRVPVLVISEAGVLTA